MALFFTAIMFGLAGLVYSSDRLVNSSSAIANNLGVSPLLIGLTIVAFGTSAPEMIVSATAAIEGHGPLAVGNALGSNIANIGLILGITALITPLPVTGELVKKEGFVLTGITGLSGLLLFDQLLSRSDALLLFLALAILTTIIIRSALRNRSNHSGADYIPELKNRTATGWLIVSLIALLGCSKALVWGAVGLAESYGVSEAVIGLTIVAIGTSLPELAASIAAALKGEQDLAIGNVVGSNILNLLAVLPIAPAVTPFPVDKALVNRDYVATLVFTLALFLLMWIKQKNFKGINRPEGALFLAGYAGYIGLVAMSTLGN